MTRRPRDREPWTAAELAEALGLPLAGVVARCRAGGLFFSAAWEDAGVWHIPARSAAALLALAGSGPLLTLAEAAEWLGVDRSTVHRHRHRLPLVEPLPGVVRVDAARLSGWSGKPKSKDGRPIPGRGGRGQKGAGPVPDGALSGSGALSFPVPTRGGGGDGGSLRSRRRSKTGGGGGVTDAGAAA